MMHFEVLANWINERGFTAIAEIGIYKGQTTKFLLENCPKLLRYVMVDIAPDEGFKREILLAEPRAEFYVKDSVAASKEIQDGALDLVFVDADHQYEAVMLDLKHWEPKVRAGGIFCGHDYENIAHQGVKTAVDEYFGNRPVKIINCGANQSNNIWMIEI